ncbi:MAG: hypothetical protein B7Z80_07590 [Rhodospirillales bacterium 20-64-7]|nr:MAG: hypothetical protein B7Z80_07590 [Rhodospirillales bacterium 20-64-7]
MAQSVRKLAYTASAAGMLAIFAGASGAQAIPAFAAQTGEPCSACHIGFPQLTPYGREFKMEGYVAGGSVPGFKNFAAMTEAGFTYLHSKVPGGLAPDFPSNNAWSVQQTSIFYGGALYAPIGLGAFIQGTYDGIAHQFHWDNLDIRLARPTALAGKPLFYGFTVNNAPSVTDLWNAPPAWGYPFIPDSLAVGNAAGPQLSALAQSVLGIGSYAAMNVTLNDLLYGEVDLYRPLPNRTAYALGVGPEVPIAGVIPYWRLALQHSWAANSIEFGTLGLEDNPYPAGFSHGPADHLTDLGADAQFQWIKPHQAVSAQALFIHEAQDWAASYPLGATQNLHDTLESLTLTASWLGWQKFGVTESYNTVFGSRDTGLYAAAPISGSANGAPLTDSVTSELDYYPWNNGGPAVFPWVNAKLFVENTTYLRFNGLARNYDGAGRSASANDVWFAGIWLVF